MQQVLEIISELHQLSGNEQLNFLKQNKDVPMLREVLFYGSTPNLQYKISDAKLSKAVDQVVNDYEEQKNNGHVFVLGVPNEKDWAHFKSVLNTFASQSGVKDDDIYNFIEHLYFTFQSKYVDLLEDVLLKDLRLGMGISSFNKVWSDFYVVPTCMLAKKFEGKKPANSVYSRKLDGFRAMFIDGKFYSRTYKEVNSEPLKHILEALKDFSQDTVLDGEIIYFGSDFKEDFQKTIALAGKEIYQDGCENLQFVIFDMLDRDEFIAKKITQPFTSTYKNLLDCFKKDDDNAIIEYGLFETVYNEIKVVAQFEESSFGFLSDRVNKYGWEGMMIRDADKPYECKRTSNLQKIKQMQDDEFPLVGFTYGTGKFLNSLGALTVQLPSGQTVDVGSGYTDIIRDSILKNMDTILRAGVMVKVQFFERTVDKHGKDSLRFPVFKSFRYKNGTEVLF